MLLKLIKPTENKIKKKNIPYYSKPIITPITSEILIDCNCQL